MSSQDQSSKMSKKSKKNISNDFLINLCALNRTFAMIKPDAYANIGKIITVIEKSGLLISNVKMTKMTLKDA